MKRIMITVSVVMLLLWLVILAPAASRTGNFRWNEFASNYLSPLDGQGTKTEPVYNTTRCAWNDQDKVVNLGTGDLSSSTANTICLIADYDDSARGNYPKHVTFQVYAASNTLDVTLANDFGNVWHSPPSVASGNKRLWELCIADPIADTGNVDEINPLTYWPEVYGTNGGRGQIVNYTLTISSFQRTTRKVTAYFEIAQGGALGQRYNTLKSTPCPENDGL
jgi:hypothetical protein